MTSFTFDLRFSLLIGLSLLAGWGCAERPLPDSFSDAPDFYLRGELGGQPLDLTAGLEGYYLETGFERDENEVRSFVGTLGLESCPDCPGALRLRIRDFETSQAGSPASVAEALAPGDYAFFYQNGGRSVFRVAFQSSHNGQAPASYLWELGDGNLSLQPNPTHEYPDTLGFDPEVCLEAETADGCVTRICESLQLQDSSCRIDFEHRLFPDGTYVEFRSAPQGTPPFRYQWDFGDGFGSRLGNPGYFYATAAQYEAYVTLRDANGCEAERCKVIAADPELCETNFTYTVSPINIPDSLAFSQVSLSWRDAGGQLYTSSAERQPSDSRFEILSAAPYRRNRNDEAVMRLEVAVDCSLFGENGDTLRLENGRGFIGLAYPD